MKNIFLYSLCFALTSIFLASCGDTRRITYMQGKFDTTALSQVPAIDPVIQKGDLLNIIVYSDNPQATALYNQSLISVASSSSTAGGGSSGAGAQGGAGASSAAPSVGAAPSTPGYLVDENGNIQFQGLGNLHIQGLTRKDLRELLDSKFKDSLLKNPYYTIRFLNYKFTMLGEVARPGIFNIPGERISLLEAIGMAGDLTFYGRRDNVLIVRENGGKREFGRVDLTKPEVMASPYFYLQQNDIVYIEPTRKKVVAADEVTTRNISIAVSIVTALGILYSIFR